MTGPTPGQGDEIPQPWGGRPPESHYGIGWDGRPPEPHYTDGGYQPPFPRPRRGPDRKMVVAIATAVVVVIGAGVALWYYGVGPGHGNPQPVAATSRNPPPARPVVHPTPSTGPSASTPDGAAAYDVGSCFDEQSGAPGKVELNPTPCGGPAAVFVINSIVASTGDCEVGADGADYHDHGYEVPDETANVAYCASLVVPVNVCFVLGGTAPITRAVCGSGPNVVQVLSIESAPTANQACTDKPNPDVWFYQAPTSGQYACVSRPGTTPVTTTVPAG